MIRRRLLLALPCLCLCFSPLLGGEEKAAIPKISLADGRLSLQPPQEWKKVKPRNRIIRFEFAAPAIKGDEQDGRITVMGAGGSIEANVARWQGQFLQPDNGSTKERTKVAKKKVSGCEVHVVDISGTFKDKPGGPFSRTPAVQRKGYRMLTAIIVTPKSGQYFVKMYGPKKTIAANEKAFSKMIDAANFK